MILPNVFGFFGAAIRGFWAKLRGFETLVNAQESEARLFLCDSCEQLCYESRQCRRCTCWVDFKVQLATEECPLGHWRRIWRKKLTGSGL